MQIKMHFSYDVQVFLVGKYDYIFSNILFYYFLDEDWLKKDES